MADINNSLGQISGGSAINQNNVDIVKYIAVDTIFDIAARDFIIDAVNALPQYTISEIQSWWINVITGTDAEHPIPVTLKYKVINRGKGTYGVGGTQLTYADLYLLSTILASPEDISNLPSTDIFTIEDLGGLSISDYVNEHVPPYVFQDQIDGYTIINTGIEPDVVSYLFIGAGGTYGDGASQTTDEDFTELAGINEGVHNLQQVTDAGNNTTNSIFVNTLGLYDPVNGAYPTELRVEDGTLIFETSFFPGTNTSFFGDGSGVTFNTGASSLSILTNQDSVGYSTITAPEFTSPTNMVLVKSVNSFDADVFGNIDISLQDVIDIDNSITDGDYIGLFNAYEIQFASLTPGSSALAVFGIFDETGFLTLNDNASNSIKLLPEDGVGIKTGSDYAYIKSDDITSPDQIFQLPDKGAGEYILATLDDITGGGVTSVSGTTNRITSTGGTTPVIDISATFESLLGKVANPLSQFATTTSAQLATVLSDETGSGLAVFNNAPTLINPIVGTQTANDNSTKAASTAYVDSKRQDNILLLSSPTNLVDATTYYFVTTQSVLPTSGGKYTIAQFTTTQLSWAVSIGTTSGGSGTSENAVMTLYNITQATSIVLSSTMKTDNFYTGFVGSGAFSIAPNDALEVRILTPTYVGNPNGVAISVRLILTN